MIHPSAQAFARPMPRGRDALLEPISWLRPRERLNDRPHTRVRLAYRLAKRPLDIAVAIGLLMIFALPMLLMALAIRLETPGPVLFRQRRIGLSGRRFQLLKFRTMYHPSRCDAEAAMWHQATRDDPRITRVGAFLRRTSLDELPQVFNVLRGEMAVVGPRPHAPGTRAAGRLFEDVSPRYSERHEVRPGITGLAQVRGWRGETDTEDKLLHRLDCDLEYIAHWSPRLDLLILWRTIFTVLRMRNAY
jgi:lipopolysaccharide/colanic/teichoic acid biosynthesis glycosyltransferase